METANNSENNSENNEPCGITNLGNTCYLNTAIQVLFNNNALRSCVLAARSVQDTQGNGQGQDDTKVRFCAELADVLDIVWVQRKSVTPRRFVKKMASMFKDRITVMMQNDMEEIVNIMVEALTREMGMQLPEAVLENTRQRLDAAKTRGSKSDVLVAQMEMSWLQSHAREHSALCNIVYGQQITQIRCSGCKYITHSHEVFVTLPLAFHESLALPISLKDMIHVHMDSETLTDWQCDRCKQRSNVNKSIKFWRMPDMLMFVLKRFDMMNNGKITTPVSIPDTLDLDEMCIYDTACRYTIQSIGCHSGNMHNGHYYALCRKPNNVWYIIDDDSVRRVDSHHLWTKDAYFVVYSRH